MIASVIKERRRERSRRKGKGNGREDVLVISETRLRQDYIKKNRSGLQRGERGGGGEMGEGVGGGRNWMRSRRPRGVDLDRHDLTAEAQMRCACVFVYTCGYFCAQICVGVLKSVWMCLKQREMRGNKGEI